MKKAGDINADEVQSEADLADAIEKEKRWREYNSQLLSHLFTTDEYAQEYDQARRPVHVVGRSFEAPARYRETECTK
jgi:hypothetical protein